MSNLNDPGGDRFIAGSIGPNPSTGMAKFLDPFKVNKALFGGTRFEPDPISEQLATLSRLQWQQGANLMYPAESQLIQYAEDPNMIARMRDQAKGNVDESFSAQAGARQRVMSLMGVSPTGAQAGAMNKQTALNRAQAEAGAMNEAMQLTAANQQGALQGYR